MNTPCKIISSRQRVILLIIFLITLLALAGIILKILRRPETKKTTGPNFTVEKYKAQSAPIAPFAMPEIKEPIFPERICDITQYGAIGDGKFMNTRAINQAITDCAQKGGGKVVVPEGKWLTGKIALKSNINLEISKKAELIFSDKFADYLPVVFSRFEGIELYNYSPFIYAKDCRNIALTGEGKLNGQGEAWVKWSDVEENPIEVPAEGIALSPRQISVNKLLLMVKNKVPVSRRIFGTEKDALQPSFIQFVNCENILVDGPTITNSPSWTLHPLYSQNIIIRNIEIDTEGRNNDGVVIDSSRNVLVENSKFHTGDDAVVIKSGKDVDGWRVGRPSENIIVHDYEVEEAHSSLAFGSEMSGGIRNVLAYNINTEYSDYGLRMKSMRGRGGVVENIWIQNVYLKLIKEDAIQVDLAYGTPSADYDKNKPPVFRNITFKDINAKKTRTAALLAGLEESPLENFTLENFQMSAKKNGILSSYLKNPSFKNLILKVDKDIKTINE